MAAAVKTPTRASPRGHSIWWRCGAAPCNYAWIDNQAFVQASHTLGSRRVDVHPRHFWLAIRSTRPSRLDRGPMRPLTETLATIHTTTNSPASPFLQRTL
ncbi:hypothetical protein BD289DRAFT_437433 [Coniella lustricola]|uniref:Uncharacterized protein n=1 Tax=Coniella lustricola TaxID=2025994 RepID=A0A2T3A3Y1_9PEZI|nr:hypothetical protein BD289DRAFT_437433 [Coniella lustricola]